MTRPPTKLRSTLDSIERALVEHDARTLPPLGTCIRRSCTRGVFSWLNPYYCSEDCRRADRAGWHLPDGTRTPAAQLHTEVAGQQFFGVSTWHWMTHQGFNCRCPAEPVVAPSPLTEPDDRGWLAKWFRTNR